MGAKAGPIYKVTADGDESGRVLCRLRQHINGSLRRVTAVCSILGPLSLVAFVVSAEPAIAQELEPRVYSASPIDTNFVVGTVSNSTGNVSLDPSLPVSDVHASINTAGLSFTHTFALVGHTATWAVLVPYLGGRISGAVYGQPQATTRNGFPDLRLRFAMNVLGRALTPAEFARRKPSTTLGVGFTVIAPTGTYDPSRLINIGSNRWSIKPEIGVEVPMGRWFVDFSGGVWLFGANTGYLGGQTLQQAPLGNYQVHAGDNLRPSQWLALDWGYLGGGGVTVGAARPINALSSARYGAAFSQPLGTGLSAKVLWSHWLSGQYGQHFSTVAVALQYRWFNRR